MHTNDILIGGCPCNGLIRGVQRIKGDRKLYAAVSRIECDNRRGHGNFCLLDNRRSHILLDGYFGICRSQDSILCLEADIILARRKVGDKAVFHIRIGCESFLAVLTGCLIIDGNCTVILCTDAAVFYHKVFAVRCGVLADLDSLYVGIQCCNAISESFHKDLA